MVGGSGHVLSEIAKVDNQNQYARRAFTS